MATPWKTLMAPDDMDIVAPDGSIRSTVKGYYSGKQIIIDDMSVDVRPGDEIRRLLPNGREDTFLVEDPKFYRNGPFGSHYQVAISRRESFPRHSGGNYAVNVNGTNSRVNIGSTDSSTNVAKAGSLFVDLQNAIERSVANSAERAALLDAVKRVEAAQDQKGFMASYQSLIASAANHMTILAPFLPALGQLMTAFTS